MHADKPGQKLSDEDVAFFHKNGFLVVDFGIPDQLVDAVVEKIHPHYGSEFHANPVSAERVQDGWKIVDEVRQLAVLPQVMTALEQLWGRKPLPFQTLNFPIGTSQKTHSDTIHFNSIPKKFMAGVWLALEDVDEDNGALNYYPGSHLLPEYSMQDLGLSMGYKNYPAYEKAIEKMIREKQLQPAIGTVKKGHAFIWHANLLHGGLPHENLSRSRHSQVTHYYFENCKYYTPMESDEEGNIAYRNPQWITQQPYKPPTLLQRMLRKFKTAKIRHQK